MVLIVTIKNIQDESMTRISLNYDYYGQCTVGYDVIEGLYEPYPESLFYHQHSLPRQLGRKVLLTRSRKKIIKKYLRYPGTRLSSR